MPPSSEMAKRVILFTVGHAGIHPFSPISRTGDPLRSTEPGCVHPFSWGGAYASKHLEPDLAPPRKAAKYKKFFLELGRNVRQLRERNGYSQEDMMSYGWSLNHWQQIEAGQPITVTTLLRICEVFAVPMHVLVRDLDSYLIGFSSRKKKLH
jgi:hypothetical protein